MKTTATNHFLNFNKQQSLLWEKYGGLLSWVRSLLPERLRLTQTDRTSKTDFEKKESSKQKEATGTLSKMVNFAPADLVRVAVMRLNSLTIKEFLRLVVGLILLVVCAPLAETVYTWLDKNDRVPETVWYYESYFFLFLVLGPSIEKVISWIGAYLIFVQKDNKLKLLILAYPIGSAIAKILWLVQVQDHKEFHQVTPWQYLIYGISIAVFLFLLTDQMVWYYNHRIRSVKAKEEGLEMIADKCDGETFKRAYMQFSVFKKQVQNLN